MGKAVWVEEHGVFLVFGGESDLEVGELPGLVEGHVVNRIDVYVRDTGEWLLSDIPMPVPRHGIYPVLLAGDTTNSNTDTYNYGDENV